MASTREVTRTPSLDGSGVAGGWEDALDGVTLAVGGFAPATIGLVFDWGLSYSGDLALDPPVISTSTLRLTTHASIVADPGTDVIEVWAVPELDPDDYSVTLMPFTRDEIQVGSATYTWDGEGTVIEIELTGDNWETMRALYLSSSRWSGRLALSILNQGFGGPFAFNSSESTGDAPQLLSTETNFFSGLTGPGGKGQRMVRDGRFGMPAVNTELVRDGDQPGLWVRATDVDPEDEQATYKPKPGEGTVNDQIPDF